MRTATSCVILSVLLATGLAAQEIGDRTEPRPVSIVTGDDFWPFSDREAPDGGVLNAVIRAAMRQAAPGPGFAIHRITDWTAHRDPLLANALLDLGFPWPKPDCEAEPVPQGCADFLFSAPMFEGLTRLYVDPDRPMQLGDGADLEGRVVCRPAGYSTHMFEQDGRGWLSGGRLTLMRPATPDACFTLLADGAVDGVVVNEFLGRHMITRMGLDGAVVEADGPPISVDTYHAIIHRSHPQARAVLDVIDRGLAEIKANGTFHQIMDAHLSRVWAEF